MRPSENFNNGSKATVEKHGGYLRKFCIKNLKQHCQNLQHKSIGKKKILDMLSTETHSVKP